MISGDVDDSRQVGDTDCLFDNVLDSGKLGCLQELLWPQVLGRCPANRGYRDSDQYRCDGLSIMKRETLGTLLIALAVFCSVELFAEVLRPIEPVHADLNATQPASVSIGTATGKTIVGKTGTLATTATTADQVVITYTVTAGKTFYLESVNGFARLTTMAATATNFGTLSFETPSGTKVATINLAGGAGASQWGEFDFAEPIPIASGVVVRLVCTPSAATAFTFTGNMIGYERAQ